jgi:arylsulfatase A-like enzyme
MKSRLLVAHTSTATREAWHLLAAATDFDLDGTSGLLGAGDCAPFEASVGPGQRELPADGIDQNCLAGDPSFPQPGTGDKRFAPRLRPKALPVRNLVLLSLDALRYDRVDSDKANPYLALLAARGLLFERAYCPFPGTILSLYSAMTSTYPSTVRLSRFYNFEVPADKRGTTLFEAVGDAGVRTEGLVFHQTLEPRFGTTRGMDRVWTAGSSGAEISTDRTVEQALSFLAGIGQERFLLWVHFYDPHAPYEVEGEAELEPESRYDREVARAAAGVEAMMEELAGRDLLRNTAVLFFADHGEEFGDHGAAFHGQTLYDEAVRVPLLLVAPGLAAGRVSSPVSLLDLPPTAMELLGLDAHIPDGWVGRSLLEAPAGPVFVEVFQPGGTQRLHGVLRWPWKLIYRQDSNLFELYDLANDPTERMNLYDPVPDVAADLASLLDSHLAFDLVR